LQFSLQAASPETFGYALVYALPEPRRPRHDHHHHEISILRLFKDTVSTAGVTKAYRRIRWEDVYE
jgi:hypothetical protein